MSQDRRIRRLSRSPDDPAARRRYARELVRQGQWRLLSTADLLDQELVSAERLALVCEVIEADWEDWPRRRDAISDAAGLLDPTLPARLAADYAAHVPQIIAGRAAIEAARAWADDPTEDNRLAAGDVSDAVYDTAYAAWVAPPYALFAAAASARAAYYAAVDAAYASLANAAAADAASARTAYYAAEAAEVAAEDPDAERTWQKWRLVRYLAAPDLPTPVPITDRL